MGCVSVCLSHAQCFSGVYTTEWQWDMNKKTNWVNQLRLDLSVPVFGGRGSIEAATLHLAKTGDSVIGDWQGFSNIEADNMFAAIAVLGYMHEWKAGHLFVGVRNVNEDFFTSDVTALFTNSSCGIFPTVAASYPIANYPLSGLTVYFDVTKGGWFRLQRMDRTRQSLPRASEEGRYLQHLPTGVFISWRKVFCRCCHPYPSVCYR